MNEEKETYIQHWKEQAKDQSRLQSYLKLRVQSGWLSGLSQEYNSQTFTDELKTEWPPAGHRKEDDIKRRGYLKNESVMNVDLD